MKKFGAMALAAAMLVTMTAGLAGCSGKKDNTITWVHMGDIQPRHAEILAKANEIIEPELGLTLEIEYIDAASYAEKSKYKMVAGEDYDVIWAGYLNNYQTAVSMGGFLDITDYLDNIAMADGTTVKMSDAVENYFIDAAKIGGRVYGIPNTQVVSNPYSYVFRESIVKDCNIDVEGLDELAVKINDPASATAYMTKLTAEMQKVKDARPDLYVVNPGTNPAARNVYEEIVAGIGIRKDGSSSEVVNIKDTEEFKIGVDFTREWFEKGFIRKDIASKGNALTSTDEEKQYAFLMTSWKPGQDATDADKYGEPVSYAYVENPYVARTGALATMLAVGKDSKHPEEAVKLIYMLNSNKELYNLLCWGIEGEDYTVNEDGTITEIENSGYDQVGAGAWKYGNQFNSLVLEGQDITVWEDTKKMNDEAIKSPAMGFVPDTTEIATELANITNITSEYKAKIEFGTSPRAEYWDEFISKLNDAGMEKVIAEIQAQYDEFLANNN